MDAIIEEQSPFNMKDFFKQRNRWQKANDHLILTKNYYPYNNIYKNFKNFVILLKKLECEISIWVIHDVYTGIWYRIH